MRLHSTEWFLSGFVGGGALLRVIDYLIAWRNERREQHREQTAHEKDMPRFRVEIAVVKGTHAHIPTARVEILSLGSLPITINDGEVFIESNQRPEHVQTEQLKGRKIAPNAPIVVEFPLPEKLVNPQGVGKPVVQVVSDFSYDEDGKCQRYYNVQKYIHPRKFEQVLEEVK